MGRCWYRHPHKVPHPVNGCDTCEKRTQDSKNRQFHLEDPELYLKTDDAEYMAAVQTAQIIRDRDTFFCSLCNKACYRRDYFERHLDGREHKRQLELKKKILNYAMNGIRVVQKI